jgi:uncharacterized membrane protein
MLVGFLGWMQKTDFFTLIRDSAYAYPMLLALHIVALIALGGMVIVTDLRLLGLGMRSYSAEETVSGLRVPKRIAFVVAAACGVLMFGAKAEAYSYNTWFWIKAALIGLIAANYLIFRRPVYSFVEPDRSPGLPGSAKIAAGLSLVLWTGAVWAARGPATIKDIMRSMVDPSADFLFQSVQTIGDERGVREIAPHTDEQWDDVRQRALILGEASSLLITPGRMAARPKDRSKNPRVENEPEEIQKLLDSSRPGFIRRAGKLREAAAVVLKAVEAKDKDALSAALNGIDQACEGCHVHYWYPKDIRALEAAKAAGIE